jgi:hypothetical protein
VTVRAAALPHQGVCLHTCADLRQDEPVADRYHTPDDWTVEVVQLAEGERLRIRHHGYYIADVRSVPELERWIPQAELVHLNHDTLIQASRLRHPTSRSPGRGGACTRPIGIPRPGIAGQRAGSRAEVRNTQL